ncbi:serine/alanine racemase [Novosphingobium hassiacum]|uniref:Serine/alanine racemase n=1 Tax=Novosphingobium hassiacum TaxID=173676 RepID=A0A7W6EWC4_9SPHN|nr:acyltransferase [Novosphingobium hassiacum]MBB3860659.1 serine/alanine racemase [Novosphingobium hassiacum]
MNPFFKLLVPQSSVVSLSKNFSQAKDPENNGARQKGLDAGRFVMSFLVVILHSMPISQDQKYSFLSILCRSAVPFFLITSGYFLRINSQVNLRVIKYQLEKLLPIYVFWMVVYYGVAFSTGVSDVLLRPTDLISGGTAFHLWYLPAVGAAIVIVSYSMTILGLWGSFFTCFLLACVALSTGPYHDVLALSGEARRGGLLIAPSYVLLGHAIARYQRKVPVWSAALITVIGAFAVFFEENSISILTGNNFISHDFIISTYIFGVGAFLFARSLKSSFLVERLSRLGGLALGIYVSQLLCLWIFREFIDIRSLYDVFGLAILSFAAAALLTATMRKFSVLRRFVG